jgi:23S rRNA (cytosine1962-C5)-methyltransferase
MIELLKPEHWLPHYRLIDSGQFEKLEQFGDMILRRPEPQAAWDRSMSEADWEKQSHAFFKKDKNSQEKGEWIRQANRPDRWLMRYQSPQFDLQFKLSLSSFKHVGIFPEQATNWEYIAQQIKALPVKNPRVLNLFAYTGGASLAAKAYGADVTHVDSVKQCITWARENMEASNQDNIRWIVEDAVKFVKREIRRGNMYEGIILDPPAYGRGPDGEKWILEEQINEMLKLCTSLLNPSAHFFVLNMYSLGFSSLIAHNLVQSAFAVAQNTQMGELFLEDDFGKKLPLGVFYRFATHS